jgi:hypothetical protein
MFNYVSNGLFNNAVFNVQTIARMHETMARLYLAAKRLKAVEGQTPLANVLNESPQTVKNWESRGVSFQGALKAQDALGCNANWILSGEGAWSLALPLSREVRDRVGALDATALQHLENVVRAHLRMPVVNPADALTPEPHLQQTPPNQNVKTGRFKRHGTKDH